MLLCTDGKSRMSEAHRGQLAPVPPLIAGRGSGLCVHSARGGASAPTGAVDAKPSASGATRPRTPAYRWQRLRALRPQRQRWRKRPHRRCRRKALRIGGNSPPYPRLSLRLAFGLYCRLPPASAVHNKGYAKLRYVGCFALIADCRLRRQSTIRATPP